VVNDVVGVVDDQDVVTGSKLSIPEEVLSSFDLDILLSTGIHIDVEAEELLPTSHAIVSRSYFAQIDCYQVPDGTLYGAIHYVMENMGDFMEVFSGCKVLLASIMLSCTISNCGLSLQQFTS
jgi:hypothetical protein